MGIQMINLNISVERYIKEDSYHYLVCSNKYCNNNPKYINSDYTIKPNTMIALFHNMDDGNNYAQCATFCEECIDYVFNYIKSKLDRKLWIFK